jgi:DNA-directed RNA polymerase subunit RPC12/RpoP
MYILLALLLIGGGAALFSARKSAQSTEDFPDGISVLCTKCQHGFSMDMAKAAAWFEANPGKTMQCPKCGDTATVRAHRCSNCKKYFETHIDVNGKIGCPHCRKPTHE